MEAFNLSLYENQEERRRHTGAILHIASRKGLPAEDVRTIYERLLAKIKKQATINEFLCILVTRRVERLFKRKKNILGRLTVSRKKGHLYVPLASKNVVRSVEPHDSANPSAPARRDAAATTRRQRPGILLVDCDSDVVTATCLMLEHLGYTAHGETECAAALRTFSDNPDRFDLAIVEPLMPELPGLELGLRMRRIRQDFPILFYAGYLDPILEQRLRRCGIGRTVLKPLGLKELEKAVEENLG